MTVGRMVDNAVFVKSGQIDYMSRYHCTIEVADGHWAIRDGQWRRDLQQWRNSSNGTYVNSHPVASSGYFIQPGDIITCGDVTLRFENY
jgi:pSer/pThr/pTyr-binding forkhead associated (FHA) protein